MLMACITKPPPWRPDSWFEVKKEIFSEVKDGKLIDQFEVKYDMTALELKEVETKDLIELGDEYDLSDQSGVELVDLGLDLSELSDQITQVDLDSSDYLAEVDLSEVEVVKCPPGYQYDPGSDECVSFCPSDKYYEINLGQCLFYPCCDLNGQWTVNAMDTETSLFTVYQLKLTQMVSFFDADLSLFEPLETADCLGSLQKKAFSLTCINEKYTLLLTSETTTENSISGFYSYNYTDGTFKNGPFNMSK